MLFCRHHTLTHRASASRRVFFFTKMDKNAPTSCLVILNRFTFCLSARVCRYVQRMSVSTGKSKIARECVLGRNDTYRSYACTCSPDLLLGCCKTSCCTASRHTATIMQGNQDCTALKNMHRSAASDEHTPMSRRFARVRTMISAATSSQPDGKCAGCERWILHAAILEAISIRRGMFAPPRPELLACV